MPPHRRYPTLRGAALGTKLVFFSTLLTVAAVGLVFTVLSVSLNRHNRHLTAAALARHQETLTHLEQSNLGDLVRTSSLIMDSPTLRAAMETFAYEAGPSFDLRPDLLATIQLEADKAAAALGHDLLLLTDRRGQLLAASGPAAAAAEPGENLTLQPIVRRALVQDAPVGPANFAMLRRGPAQFRVACVPIVFQGFIIGTLTLGDRVDEQFARRLERSFDCHVTIVQDGRVLASTLTDPLSAQDLAVLAVLPAATAGAAPVVDLASDEYVVARSSLGADAQGRTVELYLLHSLSRYAGEADRYVLLVLLAGGAWSVLITGTAAWWTSRSLLRPLESFVAFMRSVAVSGDSARRFHGRVHGPEVETLNQAYNHLMDSLVAHEQRLLQSAREELSRLERLKESEKLAALGRTLSGAAHEINNPLTGVLGNVELLLREGPLSAEARARLERVRREGERIAMLVRNILKISHRDTGDRGVFDLRQTLKDTVEVRRHDFATAGLRLELDFASAPLRILGRELELHQVFLNIINNAYDALKEAGPFGRLSIRAAEEGGRTVITFSDNGPGIKDPKRVFEHFYTTKPVGRGTGLGLAICHAIVLEHEGRILAENISEGGARFTLELPIVAECDVTHAPAAATDAARPLEGDLPVSVLVVDDEPAILELQREILEELGAEVVGVASGSAAIERLCERSFDLVVSDVKMPGSVSGPDLLRWIESNRPHASRGFVFITGDTAGGDAQLHIERMGVRYLMKPFSMADYVQTMREAYRGTQQHS